MFDKERAKKFRVFRNGDPLFFGKDIAVNRQHAKNWDVFLEKLTQDLHNTEAVRDLCTPTGGTPVKSFDELEDKRQYVAVGRAKFKDIGSVAACNRPRQCCIRFVILQYKFKTILECNDNNITAHYGSCTF